MKKLRLLSRGIGVAMLSFGCGILASFFLPETVLIVIESGLIIAVGFLYFSCK